MALDHYFIVPHFAFYILHSAFCLRQILCLSASVRPATIVAIMQLSRRPERYYRSGEDEAVPDKGIQGVALEVPDQGPDRQIPPQRPAEHAQNAPPRHALET